MADNLDSPELGNFSIQDTMEFGAGSQELLQGLFSPETSTANPDDIKDINEEDAPPPAPVKKAAPAKTTKASEETNDDDSPKEDKVRSIEDFLLGDDTDEDESDDTDTQAVKKPKASETDSNDDESDEEETSPFTSLSKDLLKLGVFTQGDDDEEEAITSPEQFLERFNSEKKRGAIEIVDNFIGQFGEDYRNAFDAIFVKGVEPKEYFGTFNAIQNFTDMDLSLEDNQVAIVKQALLDQGFEPEDITTEIERFKNYGDLETVATKHHKVLVKKETAKLQQLEQRKETELRQAQAYKQQYAQNVNQVLQEKLKAKEFDGIPLNPKLAGELQDFLVTDKYKTTSGETLTDFDKTILELKRPENHEMKVKVALLLKILEKDPTLSTIQKTGITKKSNDLFSEVARQVTKSAVKSKSPNKPTSSWFQ